MQPDATRSERGSAGRRARRRPPAEAPAASLLRGPPASRPPPSFRASDSDAKATRERGSGPRRATPAPSTSRRLRRAKRDAERSGPSERSRSAERSERRPRRRDQSQEEAPPPQEEEGVPRRRAAKLQRTRRRRSRPRPMERPPFHVGEEVFGKVTAVLETAVMVDLSGKALAIFDRTEMEADDLVPSVGRSLRRAHPQRRRARRAWSCSRASRCAKKRSSRRSSRRPRTARWSAGLITGVIKGGVEVDIGGLRAFAPASGMDLHPAHANFAALARAADRVQGRAVRTARPRRGGHAPADARGRSPRAPQTRAGAAPRRPGDARRGAHRRRMGRVRRAARRREPRRPGPRLGGQPRAARQARRPVQAGRRVRGQDHPHRREGQDLAEPQGADQRSLGGGAREVRARQPPHGQGHAAREVRRVRRARGRASTACCTSPIFRSLASSTRRTCSRRGRRSKWWFTTSTRAPRRSWCTRRRRRSARTSRARRSRATPTSRSRWSKPRAPASWCACSASPDARRAASFRPARPARTRGTDLRKAFKPGSMLDVKVIDVDPRSGEPKLSIRGFKEDEERRAHKEYRQKLKAEGGFGTLGRSAEEQARAQRWLERAGSLTAILRGPPRFGRVLACSPSRRVLPVGAKVRARVAAREEKP